MKNITVNEIMNLAQQRFPECKVYGEKCDFEDTHEILISVEGFDGFIFRANRIENIFDLVKVLEGASVFINYLLKEKK